MHDFTRLHTCEQMNTFIDAVLIYSSSVSEANLATSPKIDSPPLLVKLTGYRLLNIMIIATFGVSKAVFAYKQQSTALTAVDWISGIIFTIGCVLKTLVLDFLSLS